MKKSLSISLSALLLLISFGTAGCTGYQKAQTAYNVVEGIFAVAQADLPSLQAAGVFSPQEATVINAYVSLGQTLTGQYESCITNAQNTMLKTSGKFLSCLTIFSSGLVDPKELAALRVLNPKAQHNVQLWITAAQIGINSVIAALGGQQSAPVAIAPAPTSAELRVFEQRVRFAAGL